MRKYRRSYRCRVVVLPHGTRPPVGRQTHGSSTSPEPSFGTAWRSRTGGRMPRTTVVPAVANLVQQNGSRRKPPHQRRETASCGSPLILFRATQTQATLSLRISLMRLTTWYWTEGCICLPVVSFIVSRSLVVKNPAYLSSTHTFLPARPPPAATANTHSSRPPPSPGPLTASPNGPPARGSCRRTRGPCRRGGRRRSASGRRRGGSRWCGGATRPGRAGG